MFQVKLEVNMGDATLGVKNASRVKLEFGDVTLEKCRRSSEVEVAGCHARKKNS